MAARMRRKGIALVIDGNNYVFRGAFSIKAKGKKGLRTRKDNFPTSAIKGFFNILLADIALLKPEYVVVHFDAGGKNFRHKLYPEYKSNRDYSKKSVEEQQELDEIFKQMPIIREILTHIGIKVVAIKGHEADDTIGTYARRFNAKGVPVVIASNDKDFAQLVSNMTYILDPSTRQFKGISHIEKRYGVHPSKFIELLTLTGDGSDAIPGVYKCGVKTAAKLLTTYGSLEECKKNTKNMTPSLRTNFKKARSLFKITQQLVTINQFVECGVSRNKTRIGSLKDKESLRNLCRRLEMNTLYNQIIRSRLNALS
jgi:DNA polymerase I